MKKIFKSLALLLMASAIPAANAGTVGGQITSVAGEVGAFGNFLMIVIGVAGVVLMFLGAMGLKKYGEDSRSNPLMKPMIFFLAGALMTGFGAFQGMLSTSITGEDVDESTGRSTFRAPSSGGN